MGDDDVLPLRSGELALTPSARTRDRPTPRPNPRPNPAPDPCQAHLIGHGPRGRGARPEGGHALTRSMTSRRLVSLAAALAALAVAFPGLASAAGPVGRPGEDSSAASVETAAVTPRAFVPASIQISFSRVARGLSKPLLITTPATAAAGSSSSSRTDGSRSCATGSCCARRSSTSARSRRKAANAGSSGLPSTRTTRPTASST